MANIHPGSSSQPLAVVGMDAIFGGWDGLEAFNQAVYRGLRAARLTEDLMEKLRREEQPDLQSALLQRVTRRALGELAGETPVGLCVIAGGDGRLESLVQKLALKGPAVDFSGAPNALGLALEQASRWLSSGQAVRVVLAGCALPARGDGTADQPDVHSPAALFWLDRECQVVPPGEGAGALVLQRYPTASPDFGNPKLQNPGSRVYAVIDGGPVESGWIGYVELDAQPGPAGGQDVVNNLSQFFTITENGTQPKTALGCISTNAGQLADGGLLGLVRAALSLYHRYQPGNPGWKGPRFLEQTSGLFVPPESRPWLTGAVPDRRYAAIYRLTGDEPASLLVLAEDPAQVERPNQALGSLEVRLFPLAAASLDELNGMMKLLRIQVEKGSDLRQLSKRWFEVYQKRPNAPLALMLVGSTAEDLLKEMEYAVKGMPDAVARKSDWQTPAGSFFTPVPLGAGAEICFVYPGAFNSYVGLGRNLFSYFPSIYSWMKPVASDLAGVFCDQYMYPASLEPLNKADLDGLEVGLTNDAIAMMTSGMSFAVVYTYILKEVFKVQPSSTLGYSLGENSMLFASGIWGEGDRASAALAESPLFTSLLAGPLNAVRSAWGLPEETSARSEDLWANYVLMVAPERVRQALEAEPRVYLTHINTARQVVIGGDKEACKRVIQSLKCMSLKAPFSYALHCAAMQAAYPEFRRLNTRPILSWPAIRLYSAASYDTFRPDPQDMAHRVASSLCAALDFPRLINLAYGDGARIFIEVGAGGNCAKWIDEILRGQPALALSINRKGLDDAEALVRALARLAAHRLQVDLAPLYR
jgi:PfaB family protein